VWGNCTISGETTDITVAQANPIRYRGYYYDDDTGLYYCNARYYSPKWRRFISPDDTAYLDPHSVNGLNQYCYCGNDPVNYADPSGHSIIASFLVGLAISSAVSWGLSMMFGNQIAGGIGSVFGGGTAVSTGINLCAFGPWGIAAGITLMIVGAFTAGFGVNEIVSGATGVNYIQNWTGWSSDVYSGIYVGLNVVSAVGSLAGNLGMRFASNHILDAIIQDPAKITNYKLWQIKTYGRYNSIYTPGTLGRGSHAGQGYTLTHGGHASRGYIQWHPGGGHHGPLAYWKITSSYNPINRFYYLSGLPF
jgi:RHS repeat-associated protein